nr:MAG TPA: hypothetical protein [Caudoviricetes sp.]
MPVLKRIKSRSPVVSNVDKSTEQDSFCMIY